MLKDALIAGLKTDLQFFTNSTKCLTGEDQAFAPKEGMFTVTNQVAHVAHTIEWFIEGAFGPSGFDLNFEELAKKTMAVQTLEEARSWLEKAVNDGVALIQSKSEEELGAPLPAGPIMGGMPKSSIFGGISDHTAHHRGALTVYSRLLGKTPAMPYGEM